MKKEKREQNFLFWLCGALPRVLKNITLITIILKGTKKTTSSSFKPLSHSQQSLHVLIRTKALQSVYRRESGEFDAIVAQLHQPANKAYHLCEARCCFPAASTESHTFISISCPLHPEV